MKKSLFLEPIKNLPLADIPLDGVTAFLSQGDGHQILFMSFDKDVDLPEHTHAAQWGVVLDGQIDLWIGLECKSFYKGDRYFIPAGRPHHGKIHAGYTDITYFDQNDRYSIKG